MKYLIDSVLGWFAVPLEVAERALESESDRRLRNLQESDGCSSSLDGADRRNSAAFPHTLCSPRH